MAENVKIIHKEFKTAINKLKYPDSWFWCRYTINPYSGCAHACIYCDARSQRYYLNQDFENEVIVKTNIDKVLDKTLKNSRTLLPDVIGPGGVTDAYQPIEKEFENTRKVLKVISKHKYPINIATKSDLILRDIDILKKIAEDTWCTVGFSITTTDEELATFIEPYSSSPAERLRALTKIKKDAPKIQVGTYIMPIIPYLEDNEDDLEEIIKKSKQSGADFILFSPGLTIRDLQAQFFFKKLEESKYKDFIKPLLKLFKGQIYPPTEYAKKLHKTLYVLCKEYSLPIREKRWIPKDYRKWNYKIAEFLLNKEYIDSVSLGKTNSSMKWAGLNLNNLGESILDVYQRGDLSKLKNFNSHITKLVEPILKSSKDFESKKGLDRFL